MLCNEIYEDCKCYLEYVKVTNKRLCLKVQSVIKKLIISFDYCTSNFQISFDFKRKYLKKFIFLLKKELMCYEYMYPRNRLYEKLLQPKVSFFSVNQITKE